MIKKFFPFLIAFGIIILLKISVWNMPFVRDALGYAFMGKEIVSGRLPYEHLWDHKPPGIYFFDAFIYMISGSFYLMCIRIVGLITACLSFVLYHKLLKEFFNPKVSFLGSLLFTIFSSVYMLTQGENMVELYMVPIIILLYLFSVWSFKRGMSYHFFITGFLLGVSFIFKQVGILPLAAVILYILYRKNSITKNIGLIFAGLSVPFLVLLLYLIKFHIVAQAIDQIFLYNFFYAKLGYTFSSIAQSLFYFIQVVLASLPLWYFFVVGLLRKKMDSHDVLFLLFLIVSLIGAGMGGQFAFSRNYFLLVFPSLGFFAAKGINEIIKIIQINPTFKYWIIAAIIFLSIPPIILHSQAVLAGLYFQNKLNPGEREVMYLLGLPNYYFVKDEKVYFAIGNYLKNKVSEGSFILDFGAEPEVSLLTNTHSPTRCFYNFPINGIFIHDVKQNMRRQVFIEEIKKNKPLYIVINNQEERHEPSLANLDFVAFKDFLMKEYVIDKTIGNYFIFKLRRYE